MDHDLYKPIYAVRLGDLDPARHRLLLECYGCGNIEDADIPAYIAKENANYPIAWIGKWEPCPTCGKRERHYAVEMRPGVQRRTLKEVDPRR